MSRLSTSRALVRTLRPESVTMSWVARAIVFICSVSGGRVMAGEVKEDVVKGRFAQPPACDVRPAAVDLREGSRTCLTLPSVGIRTEEPSTSTARRTPRRGGA